MENSNNKGEARLVNTFHTLECSEIESTHDLVICADDRGCIRNTERI